MALTKVTNDMLATPSAGGAGGINYILNPSAEANTTGWGAYADAAAASPVDGTGGAPTLTFTRSTSSPLRGTADFLLTKDAANRQGEGVSFAFTIDAADKAQVQRISFDYKVGSGTFSYGGGTAATPSDVRVFIYDVTNSLLIEPTNTLIDGSGKAFTEFQADAVSTSYRLIFHVATVSASAWALQVDNVSVGPKDVARGPVVSDWAAYTPGTNGFGTVSAMSAFWRRNGDSLEIKATFTAGTTTGSAARVNLPSGLSIDSTKVSSLGHTVGEWATKKSTGSGIRNSATALIKQATGNFISASNVGDGASELNLIENGASAMWATGASVSLFATGIPISGWASNTVTSADSGTRLIAARLSSATRTSFTTVGQLMFNSTDFDTNASFSSSTYTAPESGVYDLKAFALTSAYTLSTSGVLQLYMSTNGGANRRFAWTTGSGASAPVAVGGSDRVQLSAGDTLTIQIESSSTATVTTGYVTIAKEQSPQTIGMADFVAARYTTAAAPTMNTGATTIVNYATKTYDRTNSVTTGASWKFTAPIAGIYNVTAMAVLAAATGWAITERRSLQLFKNNVIFCYIAFYVHDTSDASASSINGSVSGSADINLVSGDFIDVRLHQDNGSNLALEASDTLNWIAIKRIG